MHATICNKPCPLQYSLSPASSRVGVKTAATRTRHSSSSSSELISRYPVPNKKNLPFDIVELMEEVEQKGGFLPNVFKVLVYFTFVTGGLSKADRELIVVATSAHNHCLYCVVSHSALHRIYSKKPVLADEVAVNYRVAELSAREKAMLDFALTVCRGETVTEEHFSTLEAHGFDREDIWDIAAIAAFFALSNRMAHLTDMRPNAEFYNMGRKQKMKLN
uniref:Si:ch211-175m2.5 n=1 Tax=Sinocyclocheilus anshuiensis TaxID=1608454 RepID=A0A671NEV9_9TELE